MKKKAYLQIEIYISIILNKLKSKSFLAFFGFQS